MWSFVNTFYTLCFWQIIQNMQPSHLYIPAHGNIVSVQLFFSNLILSAFSSNMLNKLKKYFSALRNIWA